MSTVVNGREFFSEQRAAEYAETLRSREIQARLAEKLADEQAEVKFETEPEHLS